MAEATAPAAAPVETPVAPPTTPAPVSAPDLNWRSYIPDDVKADNSFSPIIDKMSEKDIPSLVKTHLHLVRKMGSAITLPQKGAKAEEVGAFLDKIVGGFPKEEAAALKSALRKGAFLPQVPESPDKYEITTPAEVGELDPVRLANVRKIFHEGEIPQETAAKLMNEFFESQKEVLPLLAEVKELIPTLKQAKEDCLKEWETECRGNGHDFEQVKATVGRFMAKNYPAEKIALMGDYGSNPVVLDMVYKLALASGEDMGPIVAASEYKATAEEDEADNIIFGRAGFEKQHEAWKSRGPEGDKMRRHVQDLMQKATGGK